MQWGKRSAVALAVALVGTGLAIPAHAQLSSLLHALGQDAQQQIEQKAANKMDQAINPSQAAQGSHDGPLLKINGQSDFMPGPIVLYQNDFASTPIGALPSGWETNGSAQVVSLQNFPGKWLQLADGSHYRIDGVGNLPSHFTVQFDILPVAYKISDLQGFRFGFAQDNSARGCLCLDGQDGVENVVQVAYPGWITSSSSATGYSGPQVSVDFGGYANQVMHVAIAVDRDQMQVYLNGNKIVDSRMFQNDRSRYFYLREDPGSAHDAKLLLGNFRIGGFQPKSGSPPPQRTGQGAG